MFLEEARTFLQVALNYAKVGSDHGQTEGQGRVRLAQNAGQKSCFQPQPPFTETEAGVSIFSLHTSLTFMSRSTTIIQFPTHSYLNVTDISSVQEV